MASTKKEIRREAARKRRQKEQVRTRLLTVGGLLVGAAIIYFIVVSGKRPEVGTLVPVMEVIEHLDEGTPIEYNTSPPTSGAHYAQPLPPGFYDEDSPEANIPNSESYIVHSLEHGYVVIWYNCSISDEQECDQLKDDIQTVLGETSSKIIVFPWTQMEEPVVMTAWGIEHRFSDGFDIDSALDFIRANRSNPRAPEPNVQ